MASKFKILVTAIVASLALSGIAASSAAADEIHSLSGTGSTFMTLDPSGAPTVHVEGGSWKCTSISGKGQYAGTTATEVTITNVIYTGCTAFTMTAHTDMMGCDYLVRGSTATTGVLQIVCPTTAGGVTDEITITPTAGGKAVCHVDIPEQKIPVNISNTAATGGGIPSDIDVTPNSAGITYRVTYIPPQVPGICGEAGLHHEGKATGSITVTGFDDSLHTSRTTLGYS